MPGTHIRGKRLMRILRNYILKDFFSTFLFALLSLSMVMLLGNMMKISDMVIRKGVSVADALKIFSFFIPYLLGFTLPLSFLLGILLSMGRLVTDNEIVAIRVAGISLLRILRIFMIIGIVGSLFLLLLNDRVIPDYHYKYHAQLKNTFSQNVSALIEPGIFLEHFDNYVLYVSDKEGNKLKNVYIWEVDDQDEKSKLVFARRGEFVVENDLMKMKLEDGFRDEVNLGNRDEFFQMEFKMFFMDIPIQERTPVKVKKKPADMHLTEIAGKIRTLRLKGIWPPPVELTKELHERISFSFSILTFILLGFGASLVVRHREKSINFGIAVIIAGMYYLLFILGETLVESHTISPALGMWMPNIAVGLLGAYLIYRHAYRR
ncbi:MAG: LptF/LptG family permease [Candidatus Omnitrophica bacterium]|nr:LptF/LptG family permease [Candidatus Omnitrophota bacterium]